MTFNIYKYSQTVDCMMHFRFWEYDDPLSVLGLF